jgi:hypothetical protein
MSVVLLAFLFVPSLLMAATIRSAILPGLIQNASEGHEIHDLTATKFVATAIGVALAVSGPILAAYSFASGTSRAALTIEILNIQLLWLIGPVTFTEKYRVLRTRRTAERALKV